MKIRQTVELLIGQPDRRTDVCDSHIRRTFLLCEEFLKSITNKLCA